MNCLSFIVQTSKNHFLQGRIKFVNVNELGGGERPSFPCFIYIFDYEYYY